MRRAIAVFFAVLAYVFVGWIVAATMVRADVRSLTVQVAAEQGVPSGIALALVRRESGFNVRAVGRAGEIGLVQIKLATARAMGFQGTREQLFEPRTNLTFGMKYARLAIRCGGIHLYQRGTGRCR
jgi:soluble lytic murein transglycosylase-like protein